MLPAHTILTIQGTTGLHFKLKTQCSNMVKEFFKQSMETVGIRIAFLLLILSTFSSCSTIASFFLENNYVDLSDTPSKQAKADRHAKVQKTLKDY